VSVSGVSCSGKTTLANELALQLDANTISLDDFYRPTDPALFESTNFDTPDMIDVEALVRTVKACREGRDTTSPVYDFTECRSVGSRLLDRKQFLVVEGQYCACFEELTSLCDVNALLDMSLETCMRRRLERDTTTLGRAPSAILNRYAHHVWPSFQALLGEMKPRADLILEEHEALHAAMIVRDRISRLTGQEALSNANLR